MSGAWLLVVKGNLRHRIEKLGVEKADEELSASQARLREVAQQQEFVTPEPRELEIAGWTSHHPERPTWANGAFVYLSREHSLDVQQVVFERKIPLQSKHILVSDEHKTLVKEVLATGPEGSGREAFLLRRAGAVESEEQVDLIGRSPRSQNEGEDGEKGEHGGAHDDKLQGVTDCGPHRKHVRLLQLDKGLMELPDMDLELAEYLTAPASVQQLDPDMWTRAWNEVCRENTWIEMRDHEKCGPCPYCTQCAKWAEVGHLMSKPCKAKLFRRGMQAGPLLYAILEAEERRRSERAGRPGGSQAHDEEEEDDDAEAYPVTSRDHPSSSRYMGGEGAHKKGGRHYDDFDYSGRRWGQAYGHDYGRHQGYGPPRYYEQHRYPHARTTWVPEGRDWQWAQMSDQPEPEPMMEPMWGRQAMPHGYYGMECQHSWGRRGIHGGMWADDGGYWEAARYRSMHPGSGSYP